MIFHENCLLADDSHVISYLLFCQKLVKMSQNLSYTSAAVVIGTLRVKLGATRAKSVKFLKSLRPKIKKMCVSGYTTVPNFLPNPNFF